MKNMQKIKEDDEENSTQVSEEIDDEPEASAVQKEEDSQKDKLLLLVQRIRLSYASVQCTGDLKQVSPEKESL